MKTHFLLIAAFAIAVTAAAQTKISGTESCPKPAEMHMLAVGDNPNHSLMLSQAECTWSKPVEIEGLKSKSNHNTSTNDINGGRTRDQGYVIGTMENGDKFYVTHQGAGSMKPGAPATYEGKWSFTGGTGKLKGIKGSGTYKGTVSADGGAVTEVEGEYTVPKK